MTRHNTDLTNTETVSTFKTHLAIIFLSRIWKWRHKHIFFLIFKVSATIPTYSTASRAFSLVDERSVNTFLPVCVYAFLNTSVLYNEPPLQPKKDIPVTDEVVTAVSMKIIVFRNMMWCSLAHMYRNFRENCYLHLYGQWMCLFYCFQVLLFTFLAQQSFLWWILSLTMIQ